MFLRKNIYASIFLGVIACNATLAQDSQKANDLFSKKKVFFHEKKKTKTIDTKQSLCAKKLLDLTSEFKLVKPFVRMPLFFTEVFRPARELGEILDKPYTETDIVYPENTDAARKLLIKIGIESRDLSAFAGGILLGMSRKNTAYRLHSVGMFVTAGAMEYILYHKYINNLFSSDEYYLEKQQHEAYKNALVKTHTNQAFITMMRKKEKKQLTGLLTEKSGRVKTTQTTPPQYNISLNNDIIENNMPLDTNFLRINNVPILKGHNGRPTNLMLKHL